MKFTGIRTSRAGSGCKRIQVADIAKRAAKRTQLGTASCLGKSRTLTKAVFVGVRTRRVAMARGGPVAELFVLQYPEYHERLVGDRLYC